MWQCASMIFFGWVAKVIPFRTGRAACPMRASHSSRVSKVRAGMAGGASSSQVPSAGSSWTTSRVNFGRLASSGSSEEACSPRPLRTCISSRWEPIGVTSSNSITHSAPLAPRALEPLAGELLGLLPRDLAMAVAERGVAHRLLIHEREQRRRGARDRLAHELAPLPPGRDQVVLGAHVAEQLRDRADHADVLLVQLGVDHHRRIDACLSPAPRCDRGTTVQHEHAVRRSRCSAGRPSHATRSAPSRGRPADGRA